MTPLSSYISWYPIFMTINHQQSSNGSEKSLQFEDIPEPNKFPLIGTSLEYSKMEKFDSFSLGDHWIKRHQQLGAVYKENVLPGLTEHIVYTSSPADTEKQFRAEERCPFRDPLGPLYKVRKQLGAHTGLVNANDEEWQRIRKVVNPLLLKNEAVWQFTQCHYEIAKEFVEFIKTKMDKNNEVPNFEEALNRWAFEGIGVVALDTRLGTLNSQLNPSLQRNIESNAVMFETMGKLLFSLPWWKIANTRSLKLLKTAHADQLEMATGHIERAVSCTKHKTNSNSILKSLLKCKHLSGNEKHTLLSEFLIAGIDTTANCAAFVIYALATNPKTQKKLRHEIVKAVKEYGINGMALNQLPYFNAFMKEVQRMFPFVSSFMRRYSKEIVLSGHRIPPGTHIINTTNTVNSRNPKYFLNPDKFSAERWIDVNSAQERQHMRFVMSGPFGMGSRMCPGRKLATQEILLLVVALLSNFHIAYEHKPMKVKFRLVSFPSEKPQFKFIPLK